MDARRKAAAKNYIRTIPTSAWVSGGMIGGQRVDPMTYLMHTLGAQFNELGEETSLKAAMDFIHFSSLPGETIVMLFARFEEVRSRAAKDRQLVLNVHHTAATLLGATGITPEQYQRRIEPTNGVLPTTDPQLNALITRIRWRGHIIEGAPNNLAFQIMRR